MRSRGEAPGEKKKENLKTEAEGERTVLYRDSRRSQSPRGSEKVAK
jgi:hypothetical protein